MRTATVGVAGLPVRAVAATDVDRTLIFSRRATAELGGALPAAPVETLYGQVISEMAHAVAAGLAALPNTVTVVPTTTRTTAQLTRVRWPGRTPWAVAASGGIVLHNGVPDAGWATHIARRLNCCAPAAQVRAVLDAAVVEGWVLRAYTAEDLFCYAIVDPAVFTAAHADHLAAVCAPLRWRGTPQGRKVYLMPQELNKVAAVRHVIAQVSDGGPPPRLLAAGDSFLDAAMLVAADTGWVPAGSELAVAGGLPPHIRVTAWPGHAAAAEIVAAWMAAGRAAGA